jgi:hypothetical protein
MLVRRRPIARAAMLGGVGYATYKAGQRKQDQAYREAEQDAQLAQLQQQQAAPAQPAPAPPTAQASGDPGAQRVAALSQLKALLDGGALTQQEFDAEKQRILRGE